MKTIKFKKDMMINGKNCKVEAEGIPYTTQNGIAVALHKEGSVWCATELTTGKLITDRPSGDNFNSTIKAVKADVEARSPAVAKVLKINLKPVKEQRKAKTKPEDVPHETKSKANEVLNKKGSSWYDSLTKIYAEGIAEADNILKIKGTNPNRRLNTDLKHPKTKSEAKPPRIKKEKEQMKAKKEKNTRPNPFKGADDIYITKSKIAVTTTKHTNTKRGHKTVTQTKYYEQNESNKRLLKTASGGTVRVGRTGNKYKNL